MNEANIQPEEIRSIIIQIEEEEMPLDSYSRIYRNARLSDNEKAEIKKYMTRLKNNL